MMKILLCMCFCLAVGAGTLKKCDITTAQVIDCPYGLAIGYDGNCTCAKGRGEVCGGKKDVFGKCDVGLLCDKGNGGFSSQGMCVLV
ncbi:venom protein 302-like [Penaeus japonicus]|uniref:venom protein 302-like n=1 Tax=Penaeus japonicus TaxID=27405 RepID=UPI001C711193|nr:venom protein 302-like [Penaeus japonicus]